MIQEFMKDGRLFTGTLQSTQALRTEIERLKQDVMVKGIHYGSFAGQTDDELWQPGAQLLANRFGLTPFFDIIESQIDIAADVAYVVMQCNLSYTDGVVAYTGYGAATSEETKHKYAGKEARPCNVCGAIAAIPDNRDRSKVYCLKCGSKTPKADYIGVPPVKPLSPNPLGDLNVYIQMAQKRALVSAVRMFFGISDLFTMDSDLVFGTEQSKQEQKSERQSRSPAKKQAHKSKREPIEPANFFLDENGVLNPFTSETSWQMDEIERWAKDTEWVPDEDILEKCANVTLPFGQVKNGNENLDLAGLNMWAVYQDETARRYIGFLSAGFDPADSRYPGTEDEKRQLKRIAIYMRVASHILKDLEAPIEQDKKDEQAGYSMVGPFDRQTVIDYAKDIFDLSPTEIPIAFDCEDWNGVMKVWPSKTLQEAQKAIAKYAVQTGTGA